MNLTKYFNFKYLKENFKKSRGILLLITIIVPLLTLFSILFVNKPASYTKILELIEISWVNMFGMYIIPIAISFILFGYVYKKTSVDFINSMPINRKTIFITNTIGGILLITLIQILTAVTLLLSSIFIKEVMIFTGMIIDVFIIMWIAYLFMFFTANLAMTLSGTFLTQIALTMIILFIIPFCLTTFNLLRNQNVIINETYAEDDSTSIEKDNNITIMETIDNKEYTLPFDIIWNTNLSFSNTRNAKMLILGILYFCLGLYLFQKRKMENAEESFSKVKVHLFVKALTVFPLLVLVNLASESPNKFLILLIIIYYFVYDYIVRRKVKLKYSVLGLIITLAVSQGIIIGIKNYYPTNTTYRNSIEIAREEVEEVSLNFDDNSYYLREQPENDYYMKNKELIDLIFDASKKSYEFSQKVKSMDVIDGVNSMTLFYGNFKCKDGRIVRFYAEILKEDEEKFLDILAQDENFMKSIRNKYMEKSVVTFDNHVMLDIGEELELKGKNAINNMTLKEYYTLYNKESLNGYYPLYFNYYKDHNLVSLYVPINISSEVLKTIADNENEFINQNFYVGDNSKGDRFVINYGIMAGPLGYDRNNAEFSNFSGNFSYTSDLIEEFINENKNEKIDPNQKCYAIQLTGINSDYNNQRIFFTNKTEEIDAIIRKEMSFYQSINYYDKDYDQEMNYYVE